MGAHALQQESLLYVHQLLQMLVDRPCRMADQVSAELLIAFGNRARECLAACVRPPACGILGEVLSAGVLPILLGAFRDHKAVGDLPHAPRGVRGHGIWRAAWNCCCGIIQPTSCHLALPAGIRAYRHASCWGARLSIGHGREFALGGLSIQPHRHVSPFALLVCWRQCFIYPFLLENTHHVAPDSALHEREMHGGDDCHLFLFWRIIERRSFISNFYWMNTSNTFCPQFPRYCVLCCSISFPITSKHIEC